MKYYEKEKRNFHAIRTSTDMDNFINSRMKTLNADKFKSYFVHLLLLDGYKPKLNDY